MWAWLSGMFRASKPQVADFEALSVLAKDEIKRLLSRQEAMEEKLIKVSLALGRCQALHAADAMKIEALQEQNARQQKQIDAQTVEIATLRRALAEKS